MIIRFNGRGFSFDGFNGGNPFEDDNGGEDYQDQSQARRSKQPGKKPVKPRSAVKATLLSLLITVIFGAVYFYVSLPALNPHAQEFWGFLIMLLVVFCVCRLIFGGLRHGSGAEIGQAVKKSCKVPVILVLACVAVMLMGSLTGWVLFRAGA